MPASIASPSSLVMCWARPQAVKPQVPSPYYENLPGFDGFPPPPLPQSTFIPPPPPQPTTPLDSLNDDPPTLFHHGISRSAFAMHRELWDRRYHLWQTWREHVDHLDSIQAQYARDGLRATLRYPPPPALPRTRALLQASASGDADRASDTTTQVSCANRAYINFPTYSIHKMLYLHDMLERERAVARRAICQPEDAPLPDSPASVYSTDATDAAAAPSDVSHTSHTDKQDEARPWEVDWRARWQVLGPRHPHAPEHYPPPSAHSPGREYEHSPPPPPSPEEPVYGWSAPSPMSPVFGAPPPPPPSPSQVHDERERYVWQASDAVPELIPLECPLTRAEIEYGAASVEGVGVFPVSGGALDGEE
ncbi:hypothetical protein FKP32DRAFT_1599430, partial [Trametes sanguinea]